MQRTPAGHLTVFLIGSQGLSLGAAFLSTLTAGDKGAPGRRRNKIRRYTFDSHHPFGDFVRPGDWRRGARLPGETTDTVFCVVKGTVTEEDQKLFLIPSDDDYHSREIDPARGERMFCSDDEAILAGWTRFPRERP